MQGDRLVFDVNTRLGIGRERGFEGFGKPGFELSHGLVTGPELRVQSGMPAGSLEEIFLALT